MRDLDDYQEELDQLDPTCKHCDTELDGTIDNFDHPGGYAVEGHETKQWLYIECTGCSYQWALGKLGIKR